jgi:branched-chain amino acid transport system ATP-binding protein
MGILLQNRKLTKYFGGLAAVMDVDFDLQEGEILGLIGPNGAGKSTVFNLISGFMPVSHGKIAFMGRDITGLKAHTIARLGIGRAFQASSTLFMKLSVFDNVFNGFHMRYQKSQWKSFFHTPGARQEERRAREEVMGILDFMGLTQSKDLLAQNLPHGHQKMLGVCIAMAIKPKLLLLDEPLVGMHPEEAVAMGSIITKIRDSGVTIILVEHNIGAVMRLCNRIVVLNQGRKIAQGLPKEIAGNREVIEAYLGTDDEEENCDAP